MQETRQEVQQATGQAAATGPWPAWLRHALMLGLVVALAWLGGRASRVSLIRDAQGTCVRADPQVMTPCMPEGGGNVQAYVPAGMSWTGHVWWASLQPDGWWLYVHWTGHDPAKAWVRADVVHWNGLSEGN